MANRMFTRESAFKDSVGDEEALIDRNGVTNENGPAAPSSRIPRPACLSGSPRKSVEFVIQTPPKRSRLSSKPWTTQQAINALSTCVREEDRLLAIERAKETFDHEIQRVHDEEMMAGADAVLGKHLAFLLSCARLTFGSNQPSPTSASDTLIFEIVATLEVLESVYRASSGIVEKSFRSMGMPLVQMVSQILDFELRKREDESSSALPNRSWSAGRMGSDERDNNEGNGENRARDGRDGTFENEEAAAAAAQATEDRDTLLKKATRLFCHFARVGSATKEIANFPGLLDSLVRLISLRPYHWVPWEARLSALWTIANLACNNENMEMMVSTSGLVDALIHLSCRTLHPGGSIEEIVEVLRSRSIASRCILNLSWAPNNKVLLADNKTLVDLLAELAVHRHAPMSRSRTFREVLVTTRRHAMGALRNISAGPHKTKLDLASYKNGRLLDVMTDAALNDPDQTVKDRSFAAIHNLAIPDTADRILSHPALVLALKDVLLSAEEGCAHEHGEGSPKSHASATLTVLEGSIQSHMPSYPNLLDLLDAVNPSQPQTSARDETMESVHATAV